MLAFQSWVRWGEQVASLEGDGVRREEPSWVEAVPRELSDFLSTSWLRGEDGYLWTVKKSLPDTGSGALLLDLQTSELWKLKTYHLSHLDHDVSVTLIIARLDRNMYQEKTVPGEGKWARWDVLDRAMERSWIWADLGLKTLFCYYKPWRKLEKKKRCFFGQKHPSGIGSGVSVVLGSIPKLQWMPYIRAHLSSTNWTWLLIKTKQNNWPRPPKQAPKPKRREFEDGRETWLLGAKDSEGKRGRTDSHFIHSFISSTLKRKEERNDFWRGGSE